MLYTLGSDSNSANGIVKLIKIMTIRKIFLSICVVSLMISCSGVNVLKTEAATDFKISNFKTFDFYKLEAKGDTTSDFAGNIMKLNSSIIKQLGLKGLQQSTTNPDLLVNVGIVVEEKIQTRETSKYDAPRYAGTYNYTLSSGEVPVDRYREGTVTVHLVDPMT